MLSFISLQLFQCVKATLRISNNGVRSSLQNTIGFLQVSVVTGFVEIWAVSDSVESFSLSLRVSSTSTLKIINNILIVLFVKLCHSSELTLNHASPLTSCNLNPLASSSVLT